MDDHAFDINSFEGMQRPVQISFKSELNYLSESSFKTILENPNNTTKINYINCFNARVSGWLKWTKKTKLIMQNSLMIKI